MKSYQLLSGILKERRSQNNMTTDLKRNIIVCCFIAFLFSGCMGLNKDTGHPVNKIEKSAGLNVTTEKQRQSGVATIKNTGTLADTEIKEALQVPLPDESDKPGESELNEGGIEDTKKVVQVSAEQKTRVTPKSNRRFEKAKRQINAAPVKPSKKKASQPEDISFNFDNADLYEVIRTMAEILKINYIVDPNIRGTVTIHTAGVIDHSDLFPLFFQILELNGLSAVMEGDLYKIINKKEILNMPILTRYGRDLNKVPGNERMVMQIVPLKFISVQEIIKSVTPFLSESGTLIPYVESDIVIIIDKSNNLRRILQLIDLFDIDLFGKIEHRFFNLKNMEAKEVGTLLKALIAPYLKTNGANCDIIIIDRLNTLVAISTDNRILDRIAMFIEKIDLEENSAGSRIFVYKIRNSKAADLAPLLQQLFVAKGPERLPAVTKKSEGSPESVKKEVLPPLFAEYSEKKKPSTEQSSGLAGSESLRGDIKIISDEVRNALIIEATPTDYQTIQKVLKEIDILPRQVLINVLIVDVTLTKGMELGVEWSFTKGLQGDTGLLKATAGKDGLAFTAGLTKEWTAALNTLATDDKANLLSSPSLLASDNKPATINVGTQIPIASSTYDSENGVTTTTVQYRDTGIILTVTPHINDNGLVTMDINQEVSNQAEGSADADNPSFFNRNVNTTLTVGDGRTIVIGGLISDVISDSKSGVPILMDIPFFGPLFMNKKDSTTKNELVIFITPRVIRTPDDIDYVSREFLFKLKGLKDSQRLKNLFQNE